MNNESQLFESNGMFNLALANAKCLSRGIKSDDAIPKQLLGTKFWVSWILFGKPYQSPEFSFLSESESIQLQFKDSIHFKYFFRPESMYTVLPKELIHTFPLKFYLCNEKGIIGVANCNPLFSEAMTDEKLMATFPLQYDCDLHFECSSPDSNNGVEMVHFVVIIRCEISLETKFEIKTPSLSNLNLEASLPSEPSVCPRSSDNFKLTQEENSLRHYRIFISLHSLKGLWRPGYLSLQFQYPHFGVSNVVRTPPQYFQPYVDNPIHKGVVSYDCVTTHNRLLEIFRVHPLQIDCVQKCHLGGEIIGNWSVTLFPHNETLDINRYIHSYRCPITRQLFSSVELYQKHIQNMLRNEGKEKGVPTPDIIYAFDQLSAVTNYSTEPQLDKPVPTLRIVTIVEDIGPVGRELASKVQQGYSSHQGGVYRKFPLDELNTLLETTPHVASNAQAFYLENVAVHNPDSNNYHNLVDKLFLDWERFQQKSEQEWKYSLMEREQLMRQKLEKEFSQKFGSMLDDMKRAQQEISKLELRLKTAMELIEKEKSEVKLVRECYNSQLKQKLSELSVFSRKCKIEAKSLVELEKQERLISEKNLTMLQQQYQLLERKHQQLQQKHEDLQQKYESSNEMKLKEQILYMQAKIQQLEEFLLQEKKSNANLALEKEYFRNQMYKVAGCLKRERDKNNVMAKQELEQLRLEFLAREERYVLDGDRETLNYIKKELRNLRQSGENDQSH